MIESKGQSNLLSRIISIVVIVYLFFSLLSPFLFKDGEKIRKIETPDIIVVSIILLFNSGILSRLENLVVSKEDGLSANFKIGKDEVSFENLGSTITERLRELEDGIESIKTLKIKPEIENIDSKSNKGLEMPDALNQLLEANIYEMLKSNLWLGRYVETLAKATSVSEESILQFCRSHDDIGLFKDGQRWVAALRERLDVKPHNA